MSLGIILAFWGQGVFGSSCTNPTFTFTNLSTLYKQKALPILDELSLMGHVQLAGEFTDSLALSKLQHLEHLEHLEHSDNVDVALTLLRG